MHVNICELCMFFVYLKQLLPCSTSKTHSSERIQNSKRTRSSSVNSLPSAPLISSLAYSHLPYRIHNEKYGKLNQRRQTISVSQPQLYKSHIQSVFSNFFQLSFLNFYLIIIFDP